MTAIHHKKVTIYLFLIKMQTSNLVSLITSFPMAIFNYREQSGESGTVHFPWLHLMHGIGYPQNSNWCGHQQQLLGAIWRRFYFLPRTNYDMWNRSYCRRRTGNAAVTVTVFGLYLTRLFFSIDYSRWCRIPHTGPQVFQSTALADC